MTTHFNETSKINECVCLSLACGPWCAWPRPFPHLLKATAWPRSLFAFSHAFLCDCHIWLCTDLKITQKIVGAQQAVHVCVQQASGRHCRFCHRWAGRLGRLGRRARKRVLERVLFFPHNKHGKKTPKDGKNGKKAAKSGEKRRKNMSFPAQTFFPYFCEILHYAVQNASFCRGVPYFPIYGFC
jgi:hypothetical protein